VDFLEQVEQRLSPAIERMYAVVDNLNIHNADDVLLFCARGIRAGRLSSSRPMRRT
jgi:hypothetical protein